MRLVLGLVLYLNRSHVLGSILGRVLRLVLDIGNVLRMVLGIGDVLGNISRGGDVLGLVLGLVLDFGLGDILSLSCIGRFRDVLWDILGYILRVVLRFVMRVVKCRRNKLGFVDGFVDRNLRGKLGYVTPVSFNVAIDGSWLSSSIYI